jgi:hypothetical protein
MTKYPVNATTGLTIGEAATAEEAMQIALASGYEKCLAMYANGWTVDPVGAVLGISSSRSYKAWDIKWQPRKK